MNNPFEVLEQKLDKLEKILSNIGQVIITQKEEVPLKPKNLIKIDEATKITGYRKGYIYELVHRNAIPYLKRGRSVRFDPIELEEWMRAGRPNIIQETIKRIG